ncbi:MAG: hypothetical protein FWG70_03600 [Oscillospiraceae bacterium]|nr:hypothetical protein [Oscillospiraceae bacterium]
MNRDSSEVKEKEVLKMGVLSRPVKVTFSVKSDKAKEFKELNDSKTIKDVQAQAKKIKNITMEDSFNDRN